MGSCAASASWARLAGGGAAALGVPGCDGCGGGAAGGMRGPDANASWNASRLARLASTLARSSAKLDRALPAGL